MNSIEDLIETFEEYVNATKENVDMKEDMSKLYEALDGYAKLCSDMASEIIKLTMAHLELDEEKEELEEALDELQNRHDKALDKMMEQAKEIKFLNVLHNPFKEQLTKTEDYIEQLREELKQLKDKNKKLELNNEHLNAQRYINEHLYAKEKEKTTEHIKRLQKEIRESNWF